MITTNKTLARKLGRRSGGDRRSYEYAVYFPDRRRGERRVRDRRVVEIKAGPFQRG